MSQQDALRHLHFITEIIEKCRDGIKIGILIFLLELRLISSGVSFFGQPVFSASD
ncbi:hypothetical protein [Nitrosomonas aestuarii]|uniref:hypothetical protein n=1 Tax=Nitrosomonas aestuarii TaxID=52441 RepID=UPI0015E78F86|nr:hypothetical protein [Nitrosomonas aestuarii]